MEKEREENREKLWAELNEGQIREGIVRSVREFGAFVDLGGVDGLIHVSELSWQRVKDASEVVQPGQKVKVVVLKLDREQRKVGLGLKQLTASPWDNITEKYHVGQVVTGKVTRVMDFGAFVELEPAVEGLIHISELAPQRVRRVIDVVRPDQEVQVMIQEVNPEQRRISLSLKAALPKEPETGSRRRGTRRGSGAGRAAAAAHDAVARRNRPEMIHHKDTKSTKEHKEKRGFQVRTPSNPCFCLLCVSFVFFVVKWDSSYATNVPQVSAGQPGRRHVLLRRRFLAGRPAPASAGPVDPGQQPFPHPFVFPNGTACRNFDQLALACHNEWATAVELLRTGDLANFLAGLGRSDLARAAREAARQDDKDRALDQLLGELPANTIEPAKLHVETLHVNLGHLTVGKDHRWELRLANQGMRLLSGTIAAHDCTWLALGDGGGSPRKVFQFQTGTIIPVHVRGKLLRAAAKPVRADSSSKPTAAPPPSSSRPRCRSSRSPRAILAGAITPRQIAEKAKKRRPRQPRRCSRAGPLPAGISRTAGPIRCRGRPRPAWGRCSSIFEALGLTHAAEGGGARVVAGCSRASLGPACSTRSTCTAVEKRPVFASAVSDQPWLKVSQVVLDGRTAHVKLAVDSVPDRPGDTLQALHRPGQRQSALRRPRGAPHRRQTSCDAADQEALEIKLRRDAQVQVHIEGVVMGAKLLLRAAIERLQDRRLDFQKTFRAKLRTAEISL